MPTIQAVVTDIARENLLRLWGGLSTFTLAIDQFKVGEGGWESTPGGIVTRTPDSSLTDLDVIVNPSRYPSDSLGNFSKSLTPTEMTFTSPATLEVYCLLDFGDFNDDGNGNDPEIWEIGLFSDAPSGGRMMVAYGTFAMQQKNIGFQRPNTVKITLG